MNVLRVALQLILSTGMSNRAIGDEVRIAFNTVRRFRQTATEIDFTFEQLKASSDQQLHARFYKLVERNLEERLTTVVCCGLREET